MDRSITERTAHLTSLMVQAKTPFKATSPAGPVTVAAPSDQTGGANGARPGFLSPHRLPEDGRHKVRFRAGKP